MIKIMQIESIEIVSYKIKAVEVIQSVTMLSNKTLINNLKLN